MRILIFGDSTAHGAYDKEGGWAERLRKFLFEKNLLEYIVYNLGVSGNITEDLLERFEFETRQRLKEEEETVIIFAIGINDSQFVHSQNSLRTQPEKFKENIEKLAELARKFSSKILFLGLTPVDELKTTPIPWNKDKSYKNENVSKYNEIIRTCCQENNIYFIEIFEKLSKLDPEGKPSASYGAGYKKLLEDGLHPNTKGHQKIFETVKDFLIKPGSERKSLLLGKNKII